MKTGYKSKLISNATMNASFHVDMYEQYWHFCRCMQVALSKVKKDTNSITRSSLKAKGKLVVRLILAEASHTPLIIGTAPLLLIERSLIACTWQHCEGTSHHLINTWSSAIQILPHLLKLEQCLDSNPRPFLSLVHSLCSWTTDSTI